MSRGGRAAELLLKYLPSSSMHGDPGPKQVPACSWNILFIGAAVPAPIVWAVVLSRAVLRPTRRNRLYPGKLACAPGSPLSREATALLRFLSKSGDFRVPLKVRAVLPGELKGPGGDFHSAGAKLTYGWAGPAWPRWLDLSRGWC